MPPRTEAEMRAEVADLIQTKQMIPAVKELKNWYNIGLKEAKDLTDNIRAAAGFRGYQDERPLRLSAVRKATDTVLDSMMGTDPTAEAARKAAMESQMNALADAIADRVALQVADAVSVKLRTACTSCGAVPW